MQQFHLVLDEPQMQAIAKMADLYSRIGMGQLETIAELLRDADVGKPLRVGERVSGVEALLNSLKQAKYHLFGLPGGNHSISSPDVPERFKAAYDLQQVIRYALCQAAPEKNAGSVWAHPPRQCSAGELPVCIQVERPTPIGLKTTV